MVLMMRSCPANAGETGKTHYHKISVRAVCEVPPCQESWRKMLPGQQASFKSDDRFYVLDCRMVSQISAMGQDVSFKHVQVS